MIKICYLSNNKHWRENRNGGRGICRVHVCAGAQNRLLQNMAQGHIDYFELMLLKKCLLQEGPSDPPLCLCESRKWISPVKGALSALGGRRTLYHQRWGIQAEKQYKQILFLKKFTTSSPDSVWTSCMHTQSSLLLCPTLGDPMDCNLPVSSVHGILQARILEWVAISFSRVSSWLRDQTCIS